MITITNQQTGPSAAELLTTIWRDAATDGRIMEVNGREVLARWGRNPIHQYATGAISVDVAGRRDRHRTGIVWIKAGETATVETRMAATR